MVLTCHQYEFCWLMHTLLSKAWNHISSDYSWYSELNYSVCFTHSDWSNCIQRRVERRVKRFSEKCHRSGESAIVPHESNCVFYRGKPMYPSVVYRTTKWQWYYTFPVCKLTPRNLCRLLRATDLVRALRVSPLETQSGIPLLDHRLFGGLVC